MPLYGTGYIFSKKFFTGWVTVGIIWIFGSFFGVGLFPIWESRKTFGRTVKYMFLDITGKSHPKTIQAREVELAGDSNDMAEKSAKEAAAST
jgi:hypothetical protein